jgi:hypothetical protein
LGYGSRVLLMALLWGMLIALAAWLTRALFPSAGQQPAPPTGRSLNIRDILDRHLARSEISQEECGLTRETFSPPG